MIKLARVLLALALFTATTGVTVTSIACAKKSEKSSTACIPCMKSGNIAHKSCCAYTVKHLLVKSEFGKPVQPKSVVPVMFLSMMSEPSRLIGADLASHSIVSYIAPPRTSVEECVLISTFRI